MRLKSPIHSETKTDCIGRQEKWFNLTAPPSPKRGLPKSVLLQRETGAQQGPAATREGGSPAEPLFLFRPPLHTPGIAEASARLSHWTPDWGDRGRGLVPAPTAQAVSPWEASLLCRTEWITAQGRHQQAQQHPQSEPRAEGRSLPTQTCDIWKSLTTQMSRHRKAIMGNEKSGKYSGTKGHQ